LCTDPTPPCDPVANRELRLTLDERGNMLVPMDWSGVILAPNAVPVARLVRGSSTVAAFEDSGQPIRVPSTNLLASFSPTGAKLPPTFDPQNDPTVTTSVAFFGSADAARTLLRVGRRSADVLKCVNGTNDGSLCADAGDCPGGSCGFAICRGGTAAGADCV